MKRRASSIGRRWVWQWTAAVCVLATQVATMAFGAPQATITEVEGVGHVQRGGEGAWKTVYKGMKIATGDLLSTEEDSRLLVETSSGDMVAIEENSQIEYRDDGAVRGVKLWFGRIWSSVKKLLNPNSKFEVETPTAVAAVRGTSFGVEVDGVDEASEGDDTGGTTVAVADGEVEVVDLAAEAEAIEEDGDRFAQRRSLFSRIVRANESARVDRNAMLQRLGKPVRAIGVLPFATRSFSVKLKQAGFQLADMIAQSLAGALGRRVKVFGPTMMLRAAKKHGDGADGRVVDHINNLRRIGEDAGVDIVVMGSLRPVFSSQAARGKRPLGKAPFRSGARPPQRGGRVGPPRRRAAGGGENGDKPDAAILVLRAQQLSSGHTLMTRIVRISADDKERLRRTVAELVRRLKLALPTMGEVQGADEAAHTLRVNQGRDAGFRTGAPVLVVSRRRRVRHPVTGRELAPMIVARGKVTSVDSQTSVVTYTPRGPQAPGPEVGDIVRMIVAVPGRRSGMRLQKLERERSSVREWVGVYKQWRPARRQ